MTGRHPYCAVLILAALAEGCSTTAGSSDGPSRTPKYPPHAAVSPSVAPSSFTAGPAYDWEDAAAKPPFKVRVASFANSRNFADTSRWIQQTLEHYLAQGTTSHEQTTDIHFRGCILEWHVERFVSDVHINEYNYAVNLGDLDISDGAVRTGRLGDALYLRWNTKANPLLFRAWEKEDGKWKNLGERIQHEAGGPFELQQRDNIADRLGYAFFHAARLCGAQP